MQEKKKESKKLVAMPTKKKAKPTAKGKDVKGATSGAPKTKKQKLERLASSAVLDKKSKKRVSYKSGSIKINHSSAISEPTVEKKKAPKHERSGKLKVISLGGLQEIGKNITLLEYGEDIIVIDCGMGFPDDDMPGVDLVIPDFSYLVSNAHKVRGVLVTHGHEDHIGGIPYLLRAINAPVYGTRLSLGILVLLLFRDYKL